MVIATVSSSAVGQVTYGYTGESLSESSLQSPPPDAHVSYNHPQATAFNRITRAAAPAVAKCEPSMAVIRNLSCQWKDKTGPVKGFF